MQLCRPPTFKNKMRGHEISLNHFWINRKSRFCFHGNIKFNSIISQNFFYASSGTMNHKPSSMYCKSQRDLSRIKIVPLLFLSEDGDIKLILNCHIFPPSQKHTIVWDSSRWNVMFIQDSCTGIVDASSIFVYGIDSGHLCVFCWWQVCKDKEQSSYSYCVLI